MVTVVRVAVLSLNIPVILIHKISFLFSAWTEFSGNAEGR